MMGAKKAEESNVTRERRPRKSPDYSSPSDFSFFETSAHLKTKLRHLLLGLIFFCHKSPLNVGMLNSFGWWFCRAFVAHFYPSLEAKCTLGVPVCRFSGKVLILAFKRRFRVVFWFIQYQINLHSRAFRGVFRRIIRMRVAYIITIEKYISS